MSCYTQSAQADYTRAQPASAGLNLHSRRIPSDGAFNGKRVAVRQSGALYYLHTDHLGSTSVTTDASRNQVGSQTYYAFGSVRATSSTLPTDYTFTGQRLDADAGLLYYGARYYDWVVGRFTQPDTIIPDQYNPQSLNRYTYVLNNPVKYTDPSGHCPPLICIPAAAAFLPATQTSSQARPLDVSGPMTDRQIRDMIGGEILRNYGAEIRQAAKDNRISEELLGAVIRHESGAIERRTLGPFADLAEHLTVEFSDVSIGIAQMKLSTAESLEQAGYMPKQPNREARINALLNPREAVRYAAAELHRISDQLQRIPGFSDLTPQDQARLVLIGYNRGWENLAANIEQRGFGGVIERFLYDNQTLDEYYRWRAE